MIQQGLPFSFVSKFIFNQRRELSQKKSDYFREFHLADRAIPCIVVYWSEVTKFERQIRGRPYWIICRNGLFLHIKEVGCVLTCSGKLPVYVLLLLYLLDRRVHGGDQQVQEHDHSDHLIVVDPQKSMCDCLTVSQGCLRIHCQTCTAASLAASLGSTSQAVSPKKRLIQLPDTTQPKS